MSAVHRQLAHEMIQDRVRDAEHWRRAAEVRTDTAGRRARSQRQRLRVLASLVLRPEPAGSDRAA